MTRNAQLETAIIARPGDPARYAVYGDWLQAQGDPRGELVSVQAALASTKDTKRFLELKEGATGIRFTQPVLDTLLLSAVVSPSLDDHSLEGIAGRMGLTIIGRHTALGDALVTGEIFLKLVPLLAECGVRTLREALTASRETYYARLRY